MLFTVPLSDVEIIDTPDVVLCALPSSRRFCVSMDCGASLTSRRVDHPTRCAFDEGDLVADPRPDPVGGDALVRRRVNCLRIDLCERAWLRSKDADRQARCPDDCLGYVFVQALVPAGALARVKTQKPQHAAGAGS